METFIGEYELENKDICDQLISLYENSDYKQVGKVGVDNQIDIKIKQSTEITFDANYLHDKNHCTTIYINELKLILNQYIKKFPSCAFGCSFGIKEIVKIQHYKSGEGYYKLHCERDSCQEPFSSRHLVFMTYLNDVENQGGTEFSNQNIIIKPQKGKTLIFPADWTHTHKGIVAPTEDKYIITGWLNYIN